MAGGSSYDFLCKHCGCLALRDGSRRKPLYCSDRCRMAASRQRKKERLDQQQLFRNNLEVTKFLTVVSSKHSLFLPLYEAIIAKYGEKKGLEIARFVFKEFQRL